MPSRILLAAALLGALPISARAGEIDCSRPLASALTAPPAELLLRLTSRLNADGRLGPRALRPARRYALYFGASWCGPCRLFARKLRPIYESGDPQRLGYEVIFVSRDRSDALARAYVAAEGMPWPAVALVTQHQPPALAAAGSRQAPDLIVTDAQGRIYCSAHGDDGLYHGVFETFTAMRAGLATR